jgi:hypothetical protein
VFLTSIIARAIPQLTYGSLSNAMVLGHSSKRLGS